MKVKQECFKTIKSFSGESKFRKGSGSAGVYIWGFSLEETDYTIPSSPEMFFPYYVGKHYIDMYGRTHEHVASFSGGNFIIFDIKGCILTKTKIGKIQKQYSKSPKLKLPDQQFPNLLHYPEGIHTLYDFCERWEAGSGMSTSTNNKQIQKQIDWMIRHFCITYLVPENPTKTDIDDLEKVVGNIVGYENLITKPYKFPNNIEIEIIDNSKAIRLIQYSDLFEHCRGMMKGVKFGF